MTTYMKRTFTLTTLFGALVLLLPAAVAAEQRDPDVQVSARVKVDKVDVDAKVKINVPHSVSREINNALREVAFGIGDIFRDVTRSVTRDVSREISREMGREFRHLGDFGDIEFQDRGNRGDWRASLDDRFTKTIAIGSNGTLELENFSGDIVVAVGSGKEVSIEFVRSSHGRTEADAKAGLDRVRPEIEVVGTRATVRASYLDRPTSYSVSTDFIVKAPAGTRIVVNSLRADVSVTGIKGELKVTTASGDIVLTDVGAIQEAKTGNGDVVIKGSVSDGQLDAGSLNGDITLTDVKARRVIVNSVSGSIVAREVTCDGASLSTISGDVVYAGTLAKGGRYEFTSNSGDVRFSPSGSTGYAVQATSFTGDITSAIALVGQQGRSLTNERGPRRRAATAQVGDGSATVTLQTFSGDISIGKRQ